MSTYAYIQHIYGEPQLLNVFISNTWDFGSKEDVGIGSKRQQVNGVLVEWQNMSESMLTVTNH